MDLLSSPGGSAFDEGSRDGPGHRARHRREHAPEPRAAGDEDDRPQPLPGVSPRRRLRPPAHASSASSRGRPRRCSTSELARLNRGSAPAFPRILRKKKDEPPAAPQYVSAEGKWTVRFQEDPNGTLSPGDVEVVSEFARPPEAAFGAGSKTHRISTTRRLGQMTTHREDQPATARREMPSGTLSGTIATEPSGHARIVYKDDRGTQTFLVTKDEIVIGRQAPDVWVDLSARHLARRLARARPAAAHAGGGVPHQGPLASWAPRSTATALPRSLEAADGEAQGPRPLGRRCRTRRASASPAWSISSSRGSAGA